MTIRTLREVLDELDNVEDGARDAAGEMGRWNRSVVDLRVKIAELTALLRNAEDAAEDAGATYLDLRGRKEELEEEATYLRMIS